MGDVVSAYPALTVAGHDKPGKGSEGHPSLSIVADTNLLILPDATFPFPFSFVVFIRTTYAVWKPCGGTAVPFAVCTNAIRGNEITMLQQESGQLHFAAVKQIEQDVLCRSKIPPLNSREYTRSSAPATLRLSVVFFVSLSVEAISGRRVKSPFHLGPVPGHLFAATLEIAGCRVFRMRLLEQRVDVLVGFALSQCLADHSLCPHIETILRKRHSSYEGTTSDLPSIGSGQNRRGHLRV